MVSGLSPTTKQMSVSWLLEEGSNLPILKAKVNDSRIAKYTLTRRTLHIIAKKYPELKGTVNLIIREKYNPADHSPICIPDGWEKQKSKLEAEIGRKLSKYQMLTVILDSQTDYKRLVEDTRGDTNRPAGGKFVSDRERKTFKAKCYKAIGYCFPDLYEVAMAEAAILAPQTVKTYSQPKKTS